MTKEQKDARNIVRRQPAITRSIRGRRRLSPLAVQVMDLLVARAKATPDGFSLDSVALETKQDVGAVKFLMAVQEARDALLDLHGFTFSPIPGKPRWLRVPADVRALQRVERRGRKARRAHARFQQEAATVARTASDPNVKDSAGRYAEHAGHQQAAVALVGRRRGSGLGKREAEPAGTEPLTGNSVRGRLAAQVRRIG